MLTRTILTVTTVAALVGGSAFAQSIEERTPSLHTAANPTGLSDAPLVPTELAMQVGGGATGSTRHEHLTLADHFRRAAAEEHQRALALYQRADAYASKNQSSHAVRLGQVPQGVVEQRNRDLAVADAEERVAAADQSAAEYHALRAAELQPGR